MKIKTDFKKILVAFLLLVAASLSLFSCSDEESGEYYVENGVKYYYRGREYGIHYDVPESFTTLRIAGKTESFTDGNAYVHMRYFGDEEITEELGYDPAITVKEYSRKLMIMNYIDLDSEEYIEDRDVSIIRFTQEYDEVYGYEPDRKYIVILRGSAFLYVLEMSAPVSMFEESYMELFENIAKKVFVV